MSSDYEKVLKASQLDKMKKDWVEEGRKQGVLEELKELLKYSDCSQVDKKCIILKIKNRIKET